MTTTCEQPTVLNDHEHKAIEVVFCLPRSFKPTSPKDGVRVFGAYVSRDDFDVTDFEVGDLVIAFSRGNYRLAVVEKIGKKNLTVVYTTDGAIKDAQRIWEYDSRISPRLDAERIRAQHEKNYDHAVGPFRPYDWTHRTPEELAAINAKYEAEHEERKVAFLAANPDKTAYVDARVYAEQERLARRLEQSKRGWNAYVNFTRKTVAATAAAKAGA